MMKKVSYVVVPFLLFILVIVALYSYKKIQSPYGITRLHGFAYLGMMSGPHVGCVDCEMDVYYWDTEDETNCTIEKITYYEPINSKKRSKVLAKKTLSFDDRLAEKGDRLFIFDAGTYRLFEKRCRPNEEGKEFANYFDTHQNVNAIQDDANID